MQGLRSMNISVLQQAVAYLHYVLETDIADNRCAVRVAGLSGKIPNFIIGAMFWLRENTLQLAKSYTFVGEAHAV